MGVTKGADLFLEIPDQSGAPAALLDGSTLLDGSATMQGAWAPTPYGSFSYVAAQQPWTITLQLRVRAATSIRVYVSGYSDELHPTLVRFGQPGATPSATLTVSPPTITKPASGSNVTALQPPTPSASAAAEVTVGGILKTPISVTMDFSAFPTTADESWGFKLVGYKDNDLDSAQVLESGVSRFSGIYGTQVIPAGPDGIDDPHTFGPETPSEVIRVTIYAVSGLFGARMLHGRQSDEFLPNNIVPGITPSCTVTYGTTSGVLDLTATILSSVSSEFHIDPTSGKFAMNAVDFTKATNFSSQFVVSSGAFRIDQIAANLIVSGALQVGGPGMMSIMKNFDTSGNLIGWVGDDTATSGFVGAWFKRLLIGGSSPASANIIADSSGNVSIAGATFSLTSSNITTLITNGSVTGLGGVAYFAYNSSAGTFVAATPGGLAFGRSTGATPSRYLYLAQVSGTGNNMAGDIFFQSGNLSGGTWGMELFTGNPNTAALPFISIFGTGARLLINGLYVVRDQGAAVTKPTGGVVIDVEGRVAVSALIDRLGATLGHGLIA
jgi:hypothetical protein